MTKRRSLRVLLIALLLVTINSAAMAATYSTLEYGDRGDSVKQMQIALNTLGYSTNGADGKFGSGTENAVRLFQKANGLKQDGKAGNQTLTLAPGDPMLSRLDLAYALNMHMAQGITTDKAITVMDSLTTG